MVLVDGRAGPGPSHILISPSCRQLLSYITKDKQTESLVEKLCQRFRTARYAALPEGSLCEQGPAGEKGPSPTPSLPALWHPWDWEG